MGRIGFPNSMRGKNELSCELGDAPVGNGSVQRGMRRKQKEKEKEKKTATATTTMRSC
jgi:hypothetical protein